MKKILVLGGSYLQSDFVELACKLGHEVHVLDRSPDCYLSTRADITFNSVDISNLQLVEDYFTAVGFDTILSPITEIGNKIASIIANKHGLPYNPVATVIATTDKREMRRRLVGSGLMEPRTVQLTEQDDLETIDIPMPAIVKPSVSSASRGVTYIENHQEFKAAVARAMTYCKSQSEILVEEFITGDQYSIETISSNGNHYVVAIVREYLSASPYFMERFDVISEEVNKEKREAVQHFINQLLPALGVTVGPCHIEVKIDASNKVRLIEIASRSGLLRDRLIRTAGGPEYNKLILNAYLGITVSEPTPPSTNGMLGIIAYPADMESFYKAQADGVLLDYYLNGQPMTSNPTMLTDAVGYYFIRNESVSFFENYKVQL